MIQLSDTVWVRPDKVSAIFEDELEKNRFTAFAIVDGVKIRISEDMLYLYRNHPELRQKIKNIVYDIRDSLSQE